MFRLDGKKALVTGANGGLGKAIADGLFSQGAEVYGTRCEATGIAEISKRYGTEALVPDQSNLETIDVAVDKIFKRIGGFDILCNNAGVISHN